MTNYLPEPGIALVKLTPKYSGIKAPEKTYDSIMQGKIISVNVDDKYHAHLVGKIGYWRQFKDDLRLKDDYAFIVCDDILGTSEE